MSSSGTSFRSHTTYSEAYKQLKEYDVLVVAGGNAEEVIKNKSEPLGLIRAFADLQTPATRFVHLERHNARAMSCWLRRIALCLIA